MVTDKIKQLADFQEKVAELQKEIDKERMKVLAHLHEKYGFEDAGQFVRAVREATGLDRGVSSKGKHHRKHARITQEMRDKIKVALQAGETGAQIAEDFGISLPSVYNIKKDFGLVKTRKRK